MKSDNVIALPSPATIETSRSALEEIARAGAIKMLRSALLAGVRPVDGTPAPLAARGLLR